MPGNDEADRAIRRAIRRYQEQMEQTWARAQSSLDRHLRDEILGNSSIPDENLTAAQQRRFFTRSQIGPWVLDRPSVHNWTANWAATDFGVIEPRRVAEPLIPTPSPDDYVSGMREAFRSGSIKVETPAEVSYEKLYDPILIKLLMEHVEPTIAIHIAGNLWMLQHFHGKDLDLTVRRIDSLEKVNNKPPDRYRLTVTYSSKTHQMSLVVEEGGKVRRC